MSRRAAVTAANKARAKHGEGCYPGRTVEYRIWVGLRNRCNNPNNHRFPWYGGRGIKVCERWNDYANFLADMGRRPSPNHSIDRIDSDGPYSSENCRWATKAEQTQNSRNAKLTPAQVLAIRADTRSGPQVAKAHGVKHHVIYRIRGGKAWTNV